PLHKKEARIPRRARAGADHSRGAVMPPPPSVTTSATPPPHFCNGADAPFVLGWALGEPQPPALLGNPSTSRHPRPAGCASPAPPAVALALPVPPGRAGAPAAPLLFPQARFFVDRRYAVASALCSAAGLKGSAAIFSIRCHPPSL